MRFYNIAVTDPSGSGQPTTWTSYVNGQSDPGALDIELDLPVGPYATPIGQSGAHVRIWGISIQTIGQASNFNGKNISISGGMQKGLPLANPQQNGLLLSGTIFQAFGNWIGTDQTLDFIVFAQTGKKNLALNWKKGTKMADAINSTLTTAFPGYTADIQISDSLVFFQDVPGFYSSIASFAQWVKLTSASILNPTGSSGQSRAGVDIVIRDKKFIVRDDTTSRQPKQINFTDLIGQPTWYAPNEISVTVVMRADIGVLDYIKLPPTLATTLPSSMSQFRSNSVFQGTFKVNEIRHVGRFRSPSGGDWITVLNCVTAPSTSGTTSVTDLAPGG